MQNFYSNKTINKTSLVDSDDNYRKGLDDVLAGLKAAMLEAKKDGTCRDNAILATQEKDYQTEHQPEPQQQVQQNINDVQMIETVSKLCPQPMPVQSINSIQTLHANAETVHKRYTKPNTNGTPNLTQTVYKQYTEPDTNGTQTVHENWETVHKRYTQPNTNGTQTVHKFQDFSSLPATYKKLLKALYVNAQMSGNRTTTKLSLASIVEMAQIGSSSVKNTICRLKNRGLLITKEYKDGRDGWVIYEIPKEVFLDILAYENGTQTVSKRYTQPNTQPNTEPPYSSSIINNNNITTTSNTTQTTLPTEWQAIDIAPLADIGLSEKHILALYETSKVTPDVVQESINHYAWGLKNNPDPYKRYKNHLFTLMGVLQKGRQWIESRYESEIDALAKEMESRERQQNERREKQMNELVDLMFPDWESELTPEQKKKITPSPGGGIRLDSDVVSMLLKNYFKKEVLLPRLRKEAQLQASRL